jgi:hypothetical protein
LVLVWDGVELTHTQYLNGEESAAGAGVEGRISETNGPWYIGYDDCCGNSRDFDGIIDDIGIWDKALTAEEVAKIYSYGLEGIGLEGGAGFVLKFTDVATTPEGSVSVSWTSRPDQVYSIRYTADLSQPIDAWIELDDGIESEGATTSFTTPPFADSPKVIYLVVSEVQ